MKLALVLVIFVFLAGLDLTLGRPLDKQKDQGQRNANIYILGNLHNAAVSHNFSKTQAASDRNGSEWNSTQMDNKVNNIGNNQDDQKKKNTRDGLTIFAGGDASNIALVFTGSESPSAENDQNSG